MIFPIFSEETFFKDIEGWLDSGGSANVCHPESGESLLHFAAEFQDITAIEYLVNSGCDINQRDIYGQTPLHIAVDSDIDGAIQNDEPLKYIAARKLIELGADLTIQNYKGETPLDWVNNYGEKARKIFNEEVLNVNSN